MKLELNSVKTEQRNRENTKRQNKQALVQSKRQREQHIAHLDESRRRLEAIELEVMALEEERRLIKETDEQAHDSLENIWEQQYQFRGVIDMVDEALEGLKRRRDELSKEEEELNSTLHQIKKYKFGMDEISTLVAHDISDTEMFTTATYEPKSRRDDTSCHICCSGSSKNMLHMGCARLCCCEECLKTIMAGSSPVCVHCNTAATKSDFVKVFFG